MAADDAGRPQDAEPVLSALLKQWPQNFQVVEELGMVRAELGQDSSALVLLSKATKLDPSSAVAFANLGALQIKLQQSHAAALALRRAAELEPKSAQNQSALGIALMQDGQPGPAAQAFAHAADLTPPDPDLLYNWGVALLAAGDAAKAADVISRYPAPESSAPVQSLMGDIAEHRSKFEDAVQHYRAAATLDPSEQNLYMLGMEFVKHWTFDPAITIFDFGIARYPGSTRLLSGKGIAKYANNNYAEAAEIFSSLLLKDPDNAFYARVLGHSCNLMPDATAGCDTLIDFATRHPKNAEAETYAAASILHKPSDSGNLAKAEALLTRAIATNPSLADAYFQLGILKQQKNDWDGSKVALEKCVALKPLTAKAHYRLALAYSHTGQKEKARAEFELQKKYSQQEKEEVNAKLEEVTTFLVSNQ